MKRSAAGGAKKQTDTLPYLFDKPQLPAVSFSRLEVAEKCAYQALLKFGKKIPEKRLPMDKEHPLDRGSRVHKAAEEYVLGKGPMITEMRNFEDDFTDLRKRMKDQPDTIQVEQMWCFDTDWKVVDQFDFDNIWLRIKQDVVVHPDKETLVCIDHKTGKSAGNQVKHNLQLRIGALGALFRYPDVERFIIENWYLDQDEHVPIEYTRAQILGMFEDLDTRLRKVTALTNFKPTPNAVSCRWCPYKSGKVGKYTEGTGDCTYAYTG